MSVEQSHPNLPGSYTAKLGDILTTNICGK